MTLKKIIPYLFVLGLLLITTAIAFLSPGWLRQSVLFLGFVAAISGMIIRIAVMTRN